MKKQEFIGWICRTWVEAATNGWQSGFDRFETEEEAREFGNLHCRLINSYELAREYEVYKDYTEPF